MIREPMGGLQQKVYAFIVAYMSEQGMPPTNREIGIALQLTSTSHVDYHLALLAKKGLITRQPRKSRGIRLVQGSFGIPVMGRIAAGQPLEVYTEPGRRLDLGPDMVQQNTYALEVTGHSMIEDHILNGDYVVVMPQVTCNNGDIVVAVRHMAGNRSQATLKRFYQERDHERVRLQPANSGMGPIYVTKQEWDQEWQVQGKVIAIFRQYGSQGV
jgi:repressor LexA